MFKARHFAIVSFVVAFSAVSAFAGGTTTPGKNFSVSWDEFVGRCRDADSFDNQRAPKEIKIQCTNVEREFVTDAPGSVDLAAVRHVMTTVLSDKFNVGSMGKDYPIATKPGSCLRYKEIEKTITVEKQLTCAEVLAIAGGKGDVNDYCASNLDMAKGTSPKLIDVRDTGAVRDTCGAAGTVPNKK
jgi:hypothetical protein